MDRAVNMDSESGARKMRVNKNTERQRAVEFALMVVKLYRCLVHDERESILSGQLSECRASGAHNVMEPHDAVSGQIFQGKYLPPLRGSRHFRVQVHCATTGRSDPGRLEPPGTKREGLPKAPDLHAEIPIACQNCCHQTEINEQTELLIAHYSSINY